MSSNFVETLAATLMETAVQLAHADAILDAVRDDRPRTALYGSGHVTPEYTEWRKRHQQAINYKWELNHLCRKIDKVLNTLSY